LAFFQNQVALSMQHAILLMPSKKPTTPDFKMPPSPRFDAFAVSLGNSALLLRAADELEFLEATPIALFHTLKPEFQNALLAKADFVNRIFGEAETVDWAGLA